jgi:hypothetical protein
MIFGHWDHPKLKQVNWLYYYQNIHLNKLQIIFGMALHMVSKSDRGTKEVK